MENKCITNSTMAKFAAHLMGCLFGAREVSTKESRKGRGKDITEL